MKRWLYVIAAILVLGAAGEFIGTREATAPLSAPSGLVRREQLWLPQNLVNPQHTPLEDFENVGDWTQVSGVASLTADTTNVKSGSQSIAVTNTVSQSAAIDRAVNYNLSAAADFRFWMYLPDASKFSAVRIDLSNDAAYSNYFTYVTTAYPFSGWVCINVPKALFTSYGNPSWLSPITKLRFKLNPRDSTTQFTASLDRFEAGALGQAAVLFTFDDGDQSIYRQAFAYMQPKHIRGTVYMVTDYIGKGNWMTGAQLQEMYSAGWDIANHTKDHTGWVTDGLTQAQIETELTAARDALNALGFTRASSHVAYPNGEFDASGLAAMAATGMLTARTGKNNYDELLPPSDNYGLYIGSYAYLDSTATLAQAEGAVDTAISNGHLVMFAGHRFASSAGVNQWTISDFQALVDYVASKGLPCLTISDLYKLENGPVTIPK